MLHCPICSAGTLNQPDSDQAPLPGEWKGLTSIHLSIPAYDSKICRSQFFKLYHAKVMLIQGKPTSVSNLMHIWRCSHPLSECRAPITQSASNKNHNYISKGWYWGGGMKHKSLSLLLFTGHWTDLKTPVINNLHNEMRKWIHNDKRHFIPL